MLSNCQFKLTDNECSPFYTQIAIEGCMHGQLQQIYRDLAELEKKTAVTVDALIICGDFQATRDQIDLDYMHCPPKYKSLGSFHQYYTGKKKTPYLTIFIGGNHEAVNYMRDLYFGGWVAPRIYYLGQAGSIYLRKGNHKVRVTGLSGIYNDHDFKYCLKTERIPLIGKSKVSCYHIKQIQILRMELLARVELMKKQDPVSYGNNHHPFDIFLTHDWPKDIALYGNTQKLLQIKPFLRQEIQTSSLGSPPSGRLLNIAQPSYWFSAHMHVKFASLFPHPNNAFTHFLSLDKCLKNRSCLQILKFERANKQKLQQPQKLSTSVELDQTWLKVLHLTLNLQLENRSYYKFAQNGKDVKILDSSFMNSLIEKYKNEVQICRDKCKLFEHNLIKWNEQDQKGTQIHQTEYLIQEILRSEKKIFEGIIFPRRNQNEVEIDMQDNNDEIQLDL